jgi:hypothetical protein
MTHKQWGHYRYRSGPERQLSVLRRNLVRSSPCIVVQLCTVCASMHGLGRVPALQGGTMQRSRKERTSHHRLEWSRSSRELPQFPSKFCSGSGSILVRACSRSIDRDRRYNGYGRSGRERWIKSFRYGCNRAHLTRASVVRESRETVAPMFLGKEMQQQLADCF